jgi:DNA-binding transcriptional LysR family regulator
MLDLKDVYFFVQVVDHGSFTSASEALGLHKSTLSHRIKELETSLGVRLINRTSRRFGVTEVGAEFYQHALALLESAAGAEEAVRRRLEEPSGIIRITAPVEISQYLLRGVLPAFLSRHPKVSIQENATDRMVDIVGEGFDLAIRGHGSRLQDSELVQRPIAEAPWCLFAGSAYYAQMPAPERLEDLASHHIIAMARKGPPQWKLHGPDGRVHTMSFTPRFQSNSLISLKEAACANLGVAALPGYICREELKNGMLHQLLPGWIASEARISALIPYRKGRLPAVRLFVDYLAAELPKVTAFDRG